MADNVAYTEGAGTTIAADEIAGVKFQRIKVIVGADGVNDGDVASGNPLPVTGSVTSNAGTNLNTSTLALEAGGNLAGAAASLAVIDDWDESDRAKVNPIAGQAGVQGGAGAVTALTQRAVLATDQTAIPITDNSGSLTVDYATTGSGTATGALRVELPTNGTGVIATVAAVTAITNVVHVDDNAGNLSIDDGGNSITVDYATTGSGTATGALRVELPTNGTGVIATVGAVTALTNALPAGTNAIGNIGVIPRTSGGLTTYHLVSAGSTNATVVKNTAGQLFGWMIYNSNASMRKLAFHNASSTPTAGAAIFFTINVPGSGAANVFTETGIAFGTGISITTVTDNTDAGGTAVASGDLTINLFYA